MRIRSVCVALFAGSLLAPALLPQSREGEIADRLAMRAVARLLEGGHLTEHRLDDAISRRAFDAYIEAFDPRKLYLERADVDDLRARRDELDDMLREGDPRFAIRVFDRVLERVEERTELALELLGQELSFADGTTWVIDPDSIDFAADDAEIRERWRRRVGYDRISLQLDGVADGEIVERLRKRYEGYRNRMQRFGRDEIVELFVNCLATSFDPHSGYMGAHELENFEIRMRLDYQGIGALLGERDGEAFVERILPGGPAEKHGGLHAGDRILAVGEGEDGALEDVTGLRLRDVVSRIRGEGGTIVRLQVEPESGGEAVVHRLVRGRTELKEREAHGEVFEVEHGGRTAKVGVVDLPSFYGDPGARGGDNGASADLSRLLHEFQEQGVEAVVLDLRRNGGGYLNEAIEVAGLFVETAPVVQVKGHDGRVEVLEDRDRSIAWGGPLVVLVSRISASASEIVAGAIQDWGRGIVVGDSSSHGKGSVQRVVPLDPPGERPRLGALRLTVQKYYRPSGTGTQLDGVAADVVLPSLTDQEAFGEEALPFALPADRVPAAEFERWPSPAATELEALREASGGRCADSTDLRELERRAIAYRRARERTEVPLSAEALKDLRTELEDRNAAVEDVDGDAAEDGAPQIERDAYLDEVLAIALDWARMARAHAVAAGERRR